MGVDVFLLVNFVFVVVVGVWCDEVVGVCMVGVVYGVYFE